MGTTLAARVVLKIRKVVRELTETQPDREFRQIWRELESLEGWLFPDEGAWLFKAARLLPPDANIVEIGSYKGRSTCCLALGCRGTRRHVFAIDSFDGGPNLPKANSLPQFQENLNRIGVAEFVTPIVSLSADAANAWSQPIHFLFVDGSHLYEDVMSDFRSFFPHVVTGGVVAFHDVANETWPDVGRAWNETIVHKLSGTGICETLGYGRKP